MAKALSTVLAEQAFMQTMHILETWCGLTFWKHLQLGEYGDHFIN